MRRVAWITGASSGIGRALALRMAASGWTVAVTARRAGELHELAAQAPAGAILPFAADVTDAAAMSAAVDGIEAQAGPIVQAVLNAGVYLPVTAETFDAAIFRKSFDVNLMGAVNGLAPLLPRMIARRSGRIAVVASVAGYGGLPTSAAYGATKAGLINLAESLKFDLDRYGVTIQVVCPGFVETPATDDNPFPMPHLMKVEDAAARIEAGLATDAFEITFPRRFTYQLKLLQMLPYRAYFAMVARSTGWNRKQA